MLNNILKMERKYLCPYPWAILSINNSLLLSFSLSAAAAAAAAAAGFGVTANLVVSEAQRKCN